MAQKVRVDLIDDIDGSEADETVDFSLDNVSYQIDLSGKNATELRDSLAQYVEHARRTGGRKQTGGSRKAGSQKTAKATTDREQTQAIREWARANGYDVSDRGRIPRNVLDAYHQAS